MRVPGGRSVGRPATRDGRSARLVPRGGRSDRAMVTAELAVGTLAALVLMVLLGGSLGLVGVQLGNQAVASEVAELVARGDTGAADDVRERAEPIVRVGVEPAPGAVVVTATRSLRPVGELGPEVEVRASARAVWQPGAGPGS